MDNQEDVPEGQVRFWCDACMASFLGFADAAPSQCPQGHRIDDPEFAAQPEVKAAFPDLNGDGSDATSPEAEAEPGTAAGA